jgi:hypothetical protein
MPRGGHRRQASVGDALARSGWHVRPGSAYAVGSTGGREAALRVTTATTFERDAERFAAALAGVLPNTEERPTCAR